MRSIDVLVFVPGLLGEVYFVTAPQLLNLKVNAMETNLRSQLLRKLLAHGDSTNIKMNDILQSIKIIENCI